MIPFPALTPPQVAVLHADTWTGAILRLDGSPWKPGVPGDVYRVFANYDDAVAYARAKVADDPDVECAVADHLSNQLILIRGGGPIHRWRRWCGRRREARRIGRAMREIVYRLQRGCPESELDTLRCPECGGPIQLEVNPRRPEAILLCRSNRYHLLAGVGHPYWVQPATMPAWWEKHRHPEIWDD